MDAKPRDVAASAWTTAKTWTGRWLRTTRSGLTWARRAASHYAPHRVVKRRRRARTWALAKDMASLAAAYGARAAARRITHASAPRPRASKP